MILLEVDMGARLYSLYKRKRGETPIRWQKVGLGNYVKEQAVRVFQSQLINGAFDPEWTWELRPVPKVRAQA